MFLLPSIFFEWFDFTINLFMNVLKKKKKKKKTICHSKATSKNYKLFKLVNR